MSSEDPQEVVDHVASRIARLREAAGLTQAQIAERLAMSLTNYQRIEHGTQNLTIKTMVKIAAALGARTAALFAAVGSPRKRTIGRPKKSSTRTRPRGA